MLKRFLAMLVARNYKERWLQRKPDKWYWADYILLKMGFVVIMADYKNMQYDVIPLIGEG